MALFFFFYQGNIFLDLKSKQIKYQKTKFAHFLLFLPKQSLFTLFKTLIS